MVEELYQDWKKGEQGGPFHIEGKGEGGGKDPPKNPPSCHDGSSHSSYGKQNVDFNMPQLNLDIKFELPIYNGELNAEN